MWERNLFIVALSFGVSAHGMATALPATSSLTWHSITFGQSTDINFATNVLPEKIGINETHLPDGKTIPQAGTPLTTPFTLESRGGKVGNSHDGLTYFYTRLPANANFQLEADITLNQFGPENGAKPAGQEGAGLLVRDILGTPREPVTKPGIEELPAASNMVMNSVMATGDKPPVVALIARQGVQQPWGNTGISIVRESYHPLTTPDHFSLRLIRTDTGFDVAYAPQGSDIWVTKTVAGADRVTQLDKTGYYVGFFASRNAKITVNHAKLTLTEAHTQASVPYVAPSLKARIEVMSSPVITRRDSIFQLRTNGDGQLQIEQHGKPLLRQKTVRAGEVVAVPFHADDPTTTLNITFTPDSGQPLTQEFPVSMVLVSDPDELYVSPQGAEGNDGSRAHPLDFASAVNLLAPGGTLWVADGEYPASQIPATASGTENNMKILRAQGGSAVFNGLKLDGSYWNVQGITVTQKSFQIAGSFNHIDRVKAHHADDTGIWVASPDSIGRALWASNNLISNSESWANQDPGRKNADGFAVKMRVGEGNRLVNCYSHDNIDDGFDLFNKIEDGPNGSVTIENSLSVHNGSNGFKLGGEGLPVAHVVRNNVAVENGMDGFTDNFNPGALVIEGNRAVDNQRFNFLFRPSPYTTADKQGTFKGNISLRTTAGKYDDAVTGNVDKSNYFYIDPSSVNNTGKPIKPADFKSVTLPDPIVRSLDGGFNYHDFLEKK
ncbi:right-handed parallel beta-helix repeat-containing protein [Ewingella americana]|uniref:Right-handed parallel beta-helix repeat-containing protein n=1 Tax=Ewingella americana TaxID=41202 RepID=A0A502G9U4_9GAMM|nr:right-handed parallel beta-helix repeat-containing protein [Ewingella americana]TPG58402.1 right-handed parallel beta-helix repeat-containing protein [Ewingella americana]